MAHPDRPHRCDHALLPLGALLLAASAGTLAQTAPTGTTPSRTFATVEVKDKADVPPGQGKRARHHHPHRSRWDIGRPQLLCA